MNRDKTRVAGSDIYYRETEIQVHTGIVKIVVHDMIG